MAQPVLGTVSDLALFAQPPVFALWQSEWAPRKIEIQGWVTDCSGNIYKGTLDHEVNRIMDTINAAMGAELKTKIGWEHSKTLGNARKVLESFFVYMEKK